MGNLPFLLDEITKYVVKAKDISDLLYALSNGKGRLGSTAEGFERENEHTQVERPRADAGVRDRP